MKRITAKDNPHIKHITKLLKSARYRRETGEFTAEGVRLCLDALISGCEIVSLTASDKALEKYPEIIDKLSAKARECFSVPDSLFSRFSDTKTPQGILCLIKTLDNPTLFDKIKYNGKILALDNIQDPSNLGTILRSAEAFSVDGVVMSRDCCDIFSPKVVRGSMGAVFRLPFLISDKIEDFLNSNRFIKSYAAVVDENAEKITDVSFSAPCVVCVGNEGNGLRQSTIEACDHSVTIPMNGRAESLNASVAASIIVWEMVR